MGDASKEAPKRAQEAATRALKREGSGGGDPYECRRKAEAEGLTPDVGAGHARCGQRLRRVAERGITTAFEPEAPEHQSHTLLEEKNMAEQTTLSGAGSLGGTTHGER